MALANLAGWNENITAAACGTACGAGDDNTEEKPAACGSACGAGDK
ncbi:MAG: ACGX-repeat peptide [Lachnospiraceae bacterium]|nr:ACGX-repeat peptide [Lachnospiraceae bacterium]